MKKTSINALQRSTLNVFLFADIGVEASGMVLSVLSALARLGLDPWKEAERLADQPRPLAVEGLAQHIASLPASRWSLPDAKVIATRLASLLPGRIEAAGTAAPQAVAQLATSGQALLILLFAFGLVTAVAMQSRNWPDQALVPMTVESVVQPPTNQ